MLRLVVLISGRGSNLEAIQKNIESGILQGLARIELVISNKAEAKGLSFAQAHGLRTFVNKDEALIIAEIAKIDPDVICLAGFMRILSPAFIKSFAGKIINIHPSILPKFPGLHIHERVLEAKEKQSGCTVHFVDEGVDTGKIIQQAIVPVLSDDTPESLAARVLKEEHRIYSEVLAVFALHKGGKLTIASTTALKDNAMLAKVYTPGVAQVCKMLEAYPQSSRKYTMINNTVAVVTDGTAVLGLGDIGPVAGMPVMEGKAVLFKEFGGVNAVPILLNTKDVEEIVATIVAIAPSFGGINLEDIAAPRCFEIERRLKEKLTMPIFHDDQHGTAVVTLAGLMNALKVVQKNMAEVKIVINGAGAAGIAITRLLLSAGARYITLCDTHGAIYEGRDELNPEKEVMAKITNLERLHGNVNTVLKGQDVFIGVSAKDCVTREAISSMASKAIVFAMANPDPEIRPELIQDIAAIVATGRSDYPNQINNVLCFPGLFRGALDAGATEITREMCLAAAQAIAAGVTPEELSSTKIIPSIFKKEVSLNVAKAVASAWKA